MKKKNYSISKDGLHEIVKEVNEESMEGETLLERRLNAYLTKQFILSHDVPADECLSEARKIIAMVKDFEKTGK